MNQKKYLQITGVIFLVIALMHLFRIILRWEAVLDGWQVPSWLSMVAVVVAAYLSYQAHKLTK